MQRYEGLGAMEAALGFLKAALPTADKLTLPGGELERMARHALMTREQTRWGGKVPEDIFAAYVLFPRVNNETPEPCREMIWQKIGERCRGMDMAEAALEINHWCHSRATYQSTDARTAGAATVIRRGFGRCGEESVLLVSALRACGLPARQIYAPWWSHCDDNHAWVEVWVDGEWRYMGACEPEPSLDSGWFTAAASKAMLCHTRAWGILPTGERAEKRVGNVYIINRTAAYAATRLFRVRVLEDGRPKVGVRVDFQIVNMAAWRSLCEKVTDPQGEAELLCGLGTMRLRVTDGARMLTRDVDVALEESCEIDFSAAEPFHEDRASFSQRPPLESRMQPAETDGARLAAHRQRLAEEDRTREARFAPEEDPLLAGARGNREVVAAFLNDERHDPGDARALLESLREKDLSDVTARVLEDALEGALPFKKSYPRPVWVEGVLCPRVADEALYPVRGRLARWLSACRTPQQLWYTLKGKMGTCEMVPEGLMPDLSAALDYGWGSEALVDILFVAAARALGMAARLDPLTGEKQVWSEGAYRPLLPMNAETGTLRLVNKAGRTLTAGTHWSVCRYEAGRYRPLNLGQTPLEDVLELTLPIGHYRVMAVNRQIDGSVEGVEQGITVRSEKESVCPVVLPEDHTAEKLLRVTLPPLVLCRDGAPALTLPEPGRPAIAALLAPGEEPTEHFLNELLEAGDELARRDIAVRLIVRHPGEKHNAKLQRVLAALENADCLDTPDEAALVRWREVMRAMELRLPLAVAIGRSGKGLFAFVNYNVGSVRTLLKVLDCE